MYIPDYDFCSNLQGELFKPEVKGVRREYLQSKYDLIYSNLLTVLDQYNLPRPRLTATLCYLHSWTEARAREAGLIDRTFDGATLIYLP